MQGTPAYMAPEVAQGHAHRGAAADVWSLGVLLYNLLEKGAFPFWGKSMDELKRNILISQPKIPHYLSPGCRDLCAPSPHPPRCLSARRAAEATSCTIGYGRTMSRRGSLLPSLPRPFPAPSSPPQPFSPLSRQALSAAQ